MAAEASAGGLRAPGPAGPTGPVGPRGSAGASRATVVQIAVSGVLVLLGVATSLFLAMLAVVFGLECSSALGCGPLWHVGLITLLVQAAAVAVWAIGCVRRTRRSAPAWLWGAVVLAWVVPPVLSFLARG